MKTKRYDWPPASFLIRPDIATDSFVIREVFSSYDYGDPKLFKEMKTIVDVGANIGAFTVFAGLYSNAHIISIEPEPSNCEMLISNIALNNLTDRVTTYNLGISSAQQGDVFLPLGQGGNSAAALEKDSFHSQPVPSRTLDSLLDEIVGPISFLKVDTEGHETIIFGDTSDKNLSRIERFAIEYHGDTPEWGPMVRRLSKFHNLRIESNSNIVESYLYGGMIYGELK